MIMRALIWLHIFLMKILHISQLYSWAKMKQTLLHVIQVFHNPEKVDFYNSALIVPNPNLYKITSFAGSLFAKASIYSWCLNSLHFTCRNMAFRISKVT